MSEQEAKEKRKIGKGPISGLAHTAVNAAASHDGRGPAGKLQDAEGARVTELTPIFHGKDQKRPPCLA